MRSLPKRTIGLHDTQIMHRGLAKYSRCIVRSFDLLGKMKHPPDLHSVVNQIPVKGSNVLPRLGHFRLSSRLLQILLVREQLFVFLDVARHELPEHFGRVLVGVGRDGGEIVKTLLHRFALDGGLGRCVQFRDDR